MGNELTTFEQAKRERLRRTKPYVYEKVLKFADKADRGESIAIIQLQYSYRCNMACEHCSITTLRASGEELINLADVRSLFGQADEMGMAQVWLSGGEPLTFPDLFDLISAIDPQKFYIQIDTNGWELDFTLAQQLRDSGVDKIQVSLDSLYSDAHNKFRNKKGAWQNAVKAIQNSLAAGLLVNVSTVVPPQRLREKEWPEFIAFCRSMGATISVQWPKPCGEWEGRTDLIPSPEDWETISAQGLYEHRVPAFGIDHGCLAVWRSLSVTAYGEVMPCIWIPFTLGNVKRDRLADMVEKGMKYFPMGAPRCRCLTPGFIDKFLKPTWGKDIPIPVEQIMGER